MPPLVFKALGSSDVNIRPFKVHKTQVLTFTSGSGGISQLNIATAIAPISLIDFDPNTAVQNDNGSFQEPLYVTVAHTFYTSASIATRTGSIGHTKAMTFSAGGDPIRNFPLTSSVYIVNMSQRSWGEGIKRGSFILDTPGVGSGTIVDDGRGRLFITGSEVTGSALGNIFYDLGVAVINRLESAGTGSGELIQDNGLFVDSGSTIRTTLDATQTIYEYQIIVTAKPFEFNYSFNPTITSRDVHSGSVVLDSMASGTLGPFITTIGLYNDGQELVAVAKVPRPIKRLAKTQQSFIIRFDT
jgi:hypothetical protein